MVFAFAAVTFAEQVDNPTYQSWARFKPGTSVTLKQSATLSLLPDLATDSVITRKLVTIKPDAITLEITMKTTLKGQTTENTTSSTIPARIEKGQEHLPLSAANTKVELKNLKEGHEMIAVMGGKLNTTTQEFSLTTVSPVPGTAPSSAPVIRSALGLSGPITTQVKTWTSREIPGGTAKMEQYMDMGAMGDIRTILTLVDYTIAQ